MVHTYHLVGIFIGSASPESNCKWRQKWVVGVKRGKIHRCHVQKPPHWGLFKSSPSFVTLYSLKGFPGGSDSKASAYNAGDPGSFPGLGRSSVEGNGNPLQYSCLENPMDGGAW